MKAFTCICMLLTWTALHPLQAGAQDTLFTKYPVWSSGPQNESWDVAAGDVDNDGDLDVVFANWHQAKTLYLNGDGSFPIDPSQSWDAAGYGRCATCIALGDIDGDGYLDAVCGNSTGAGMYDTDAQYAPGAGTGLLQTELNNTMYLNVGGSFAAAPSWESGPSNYTEAVALGDIDNNGYLDLICGNQTSNTLYLNDAGTLASDPAWISTIAMVTSGIALGDVDNDGYLDLVCGNSGVNTLYRNEGGVFSADTVWASVVANTTHHVALGDVDGDGDLDLVCGNRYNNTLYRNTGGTFTRNPVWTSSDAQRTRDVILGDVDGDGDLDLVCGNSSQNTLYLNIGGVFTSSPVWIAGQSDATDGAALADMDGDGLLDIVCANWQKRNTIYANEAIALSADTAWSSGPELTTCGVALGDVNGDDFPDLACGNLGVEMVPHQNTLYLGDGDAFSTDEFWHSGPTNYTSDAAVGDVDNDGDLDLVFGNYGDDYANSPQGNTVYMNDGGQLPTEPDWISPANWTRSVALGDIDENGFIDLVAGNTPFISPWSHPANNTLHLNTGGVFSSEPDWLSIPSNRTYGIALGDVDGDDDLDLVCGNDDQPTAMYLNEGGIFAGEPAWTTGIAGRTKSVALGDIDADGDPDLVCGNGVSPGEKNTMYLNEGGTFSAYPDWSSGPANGTLDVVMEDVNGDDLLDLVCANLQGITVYLNRGGALPEDPDWAFSNYTLSIVLGDVDLDGDLDLVRGNPGANTLHKSARTPPFKGDPAAPRDHLPNNSAFARFVDAEYLGNNLYRITATIFDVESDPVWIVPDYTHRGMTQWHPMDTGHAGEAIGPLASSFRGVEHQFDWDVSLVPFDSRDVIVRLRVISHPKRVALIQSVAAHRMNIGPIALNRPRYVQPLDSISFPGVTVGDTVSVDFSIRNSGNEMLTVAGIDPPSGEMRVVPDAPLVVNPHDRIDCTVFLEPRSETVISGSIAIQSNDPVTPYDTIRVGCDIYPLEVESRLLAPAPEVPLGEAVTVIVTPAPNVRVEGGYLFHRPGSGTAEFAGCIVLAPSAHDFIAVIPGSAVTEDGLEYYIRVENSGVFGTDPPGAPDSFYSQAVLPPSSVSSHPQPTAGSDFLEHRPIRVLVSLPVGTTFTGGDLNIREGGRRDYVSIPLEPGPPEPFAEIPDTLVGPRGLEYWVGVTTTTSVLTDPPTDPSGYPHMIDVTVQDLREEDIHAGNRYRMVSVPLSFGAHFSGTLEALLAEQGEFGPYDPVKWRSFRYVTDSLAYMELGDEGAGEHFRPNPGSAFWLISSADNRITTAPVTGYSTPTDAAFEIPLLPGWNQVGCPFGFRVAWDSMKVDTLEMAEAETAVVEPPIGWDGNAYRYDVEIFEPFHGYWVKNVSPATVVLEVPPREASPPVTHGLSAAIAGSRVVNEDNWRISIAATSTGSADYGNLAGIAVGALDTWDPDDRSAPPMVPGRAISLYFSHSDWGNRSGNYSADIRECYRAGESGRSQSGRSGAVSRGHRWCFDVAKSYSAESAGDEVLLSFEGVEGVPTEAQVLLVDREIDRSVDLRNTNSYCFFVGEKGFVTEDEARFVLLVGNEEFIDSRGDEIPLPPTRTVLRQNYPNPFNPSTVIRYEIARADNVVLSVHDVTGSLVRVLYRGYERPGRYEIGWCGTNDRGVPVASGIYFYRLRIGDESRTRKMILLR